ncbi:hypothetical protein L596_014392 [Steinernema carpocapsae]|uniref:Uncharacterized protein n=1 Tax=Steinernema carpocapsae TaxID=34508 RepID=A0A4U5NCL3_STECR|nr:hypothetical protein L596_014392 [Steinernema carpocapsae]
MKKGFDLLHFTKTAYGGTLAALLAAQLVIITVSCAIRDHINAGLTGKGFGASLMSSLTPSQGQFFVVLAVYVSWYVMAQFFVYESLTAQFVNNLGKKLKIMHGTLALISIVAALTESAFALDCHLGESCNGSGSSSIISLDLGIYVTSAYLWVASIAHLGLMTTTGTKVKSQ